MLLPTAVSAQTTAVKPDPGIDFQAAFLTSRQYYEATSIPWGMYSFNSAQGYSSLTPLLVDDDLDINCGIILHNRLHAVYFNSDYGELYSFYTRVDANNWTIDSVYKFVPAAYNICATDYAYDIDSDRAIGCVYADQDGSSYNLAYVDFRDSSNSVQVIGPVDANTWSGFFYVALAENSRGQLYGIGNDAILYKIDKTNAAKTAIGSVGIGRRNYDNELTLQYIQSMTFDESTDRLYWAAATDGEGLSCLYEVDTLTAKLTKIFTFENDDEFSTLTIRQPEYSREAPAKAWNLASTDDGAVSFTAPTKTVNGKELDGSLDYVLTLDGDTVASGPVQPGAEVTNNIALGAGMNVLVATTSNEAGAGPRARLFKWVGADNPQPVDSVVAVRDSANSQSVKVSWSSPKKTVHGGTMNPEDVKYNVVRYPDSVTVAAAISDTTFTDAIEDETLQAYFYGVTPVNAGQAGEETKSNKVNAGKGFEVPYSTDFSNPDDAGYYTFIDGDGDGHTWAYNNASSGWLQSYWNSSAQTDDWAITPPIHLESGKVYTLKFVAARYWNNYQEKLGVAWGQGLDPASYTTLQADQLLPASEYNDPSSYSHLSFDVVAPADGYYRFAFHDGSDANQFRIYLDDVSVTLNEEATGIRNINAEKASEANAPSYNIAGQRVNSSYRGVVIRNGQKRINK